ncbi:MAG TPA: spore germination protein GerW family protein [Acidimicrobiia bacterium]|nr:spore germination protein GerW family protein [Acidimicrobiia bacterium]
MKIDELPELLRDAATVKRVYGDPYQIDGVTIIPVARTGGGGGGGEGGSSEDGGRGLGLGFGATAIGVYVVKDGDVRFVPSYDVNALAARAAAVMIAGTLAWRSVAKARQHRKAKVARRPRIAPGLNIGYSHVELDD